MNVTNDSQIGWVVKNDSGWNHHRTADALSKILATAPDSLPVVPLGYGVLVGPISDKPFGLRCALVKVLPRKTSPVIGLRGASGEMVSTRGFWEPGDYDTLADAEALLSKLGFVNHRRADGFVAEIEMFDDGCDGEHDGWAYDQFGIEVERIYACKEEQQSDDSSDYFIRKITNKLAELRGGIILPLTLEVKALSDAEVVALPPFASGKKQSAWRRI
jgi:hypothetical protein